MHTEKILFQTNIAEGKEKNIIDLLLIYLQQYLVENTTDNEIVSDYYDKTILISANYHNLMSKHGTNLISDSDFNIEKSRINAALLRLVNQLPDEFYHWVEKKNAATPATSLANERINKRETLCRIFQIDIQELTSAQIKKRYNELLLEYNKSIEKATERLKEKLRNELNEIEQLYLSVLPQIKREEDTNIAEAYLTLELQRGCTCNDVERKYNKLKTSYDELLISPNDKIRLHSANEIELINAAFNAIIQTDFAETGTYKHQKAAPAGMVYVSGGVFSFSYKNQIKPVKGFYIDIYPVTVASYREFCAKTGKEMPAAPAWGWIDNHPMVNVTWNEANEFALSKGKRLPLEHEWEYAAIVPNADHEFLFSGSNLPEEVAWFRANAENKTHAVGAKKPNSLGIFDMSGNVWEWCDDWYFDEYVPKEIAPKFKVLRGGAWSSPPNCISVTYRDNEDPLARSLINGFRCVRDI